MSIVPTFTALPVWTPAIRQTAIGFTAEQWAVVDSETANRYAARAAELHTAAEGAAHRGSPMATTFRRLLVGAIASAERAQVRCTNSGMSRTECTTCNHTRQLELMAA